MNLKKMNGLLKEIGRNLTEGEKDLDAKNIRRRLTSIYEELKKLGEIVDEKAHVALKSGNKNIYKQWSDAVAAIQRAEDEVADARSELL